MSARYDLICYGLTGGATGALDSYDGANFDDGSSALVVTDGVNYEFYLDASSGVAESTPWTTSKVIAPDTNAGTKRWVLQGYYANTLQLGSGTSINEFSTDGTMAGNSDDAVPTEKAVVTYVTAVGAIAPTGIPGFLIRPQFTYKDTDEIYIGPARYHHKGTAEQIVYWDSQLTYQLSGMSGDDWYYLYIDDSAVVTHGSANLTATEFTHSTTEPTWTAAEGGWYNGDDRCIGAFRSSSGNLVEFFHDGGDLFMYADRVSDLSLTDIDTSGQDVTITAPAFATKALVLFGVDPRGATTTTTFKWVTKGQTGTTGHNFAEVNENQFVLSLFSLWPVITDSSQEITIYSNLNNDAGCEVFTQGYYFPRGL